MKKFIISNSLSLLFNLFLLIFLLIGIQNNQKKEKIFFLNTETVNMPISFISGSSFIVGIFYGNFIFSFLKFKQK